MAYRRRARLREIVRSGTTWIGMLTRSALEIDRKLQAREHVVGVRVDASGVADILDVRTQIQPRRRVRVVVDLGDPFRVLNSDRAKPEIVLRRLDIGHAAVDVGAPEAKSDLVFGAGGKGGGIKRARGKLVVERGGAAVRIGCVEEDAQTLLGGALRAGQPLLEIHVGTVGAVSHERLSTRDRQGKALGIIDHIGLFRGVVPAAELVTPIETRRKGWQPADLEGRQYAGCTGRVADIHRIAGK